MHIFGCFTGLAGAKNWILLTRKCVCVCACVIGLCWCTCTHPICTVPPKLIHVAAAWYSFIPLRSLCNVFVWFCGFVMEFILINFSIALNPCFFVTILSRHLCFAYMSNRRCGNHLLREKEARNPNKTKQISGKTCSAWQPHHFTSRHSCSLAPWKVIPCIEHILAYP